MEKAFHSTPITDKYVSSGQLQSSGDLKEHSRHRNLKVFLSVFAREI